MEERLEATSSVSTSLPKGTLKGDPPEMLKITVMTLGEGTRGASRGHCTALWAGEGRAMEVVPRARTSWGQNHRPR